MRNAELARDYIRRASIRLRMLDVLVEAESWADVVREAQEVVALTLKGLLRACGVDPPRVHDVSDVILAARDRLPLELQGQAEMLAKMSRELRRDRELAFYGAEDLTPSDFYSRADAEHALAGAAAAVKLVRPHIEGDAQLH